MAIRNDPVYIQGNKIIDQLLFDLDAQSPTRLVLFLIVSDKIKLIYLYSRQHFPGQQAKKPMFEYV